MELLFCIVRGHRFVEEILTGFLDVGIHGATVVDAKGMGEILTTQVPIFAGFKSMFPVGGGHTYLILAAVDCDVVDNRSFSLIVDSKWELHRQFAVQPVDNRVYSCFPLESIEILKKTVSQ